MKFYLLIAFACLMNGAQLVAQPVPNQFREASACPVSEPLGLLAYNEQKTKTFPEQVLPFSARAVSPFGGGRGEDFLQSNSFRSTIYPTPLGSTFSSSKKALRLQRGKWPHHLLKICAENAILIYKNQLNLLAYDQPRPNPKTPKNYFGANYQPTKIYSACDHSAANTPTDKERFYQTVAQSGDGVYSILRRYKLLDSPCNLERFYELNKLKRNANLAKGKSYYLPILLYEYNRRSIRSTIGIDDWDLAIRIRDYNKEMVETGHRQKNYNDDTILWVPYHEMYCSEETKSESEEKPESVKLRSFPIFGKKHEKVPLLNKSLAGRVYYIVSGHGGIDPGAVGKVGKYTLCEDEYAYDVAIRLAREIVKRAGTAYLITRDPNDGIRDGRYLGVDQDEVIWGNYKMSTSQKGRLFQRSDVVNELVDKNTEVGIKDQRLIAIHVDSRSRGVQTDVFFYHYPDSDSGKRIANNIKKTFAKKYKKYQKNRGYRGTVTGRDLHMLREPKCTSVYVELGNISNQLDQQRFLLASNRQLLAEWLMEGFIK